MRPDLQLRQQNINSLNTRPTDHLNTKLVASYSEGHLLARISHILIYVLYPNLEIVGERNERRVENFIASNVSRNN